MVRLRIDLSTSRQDQLRGAVGVMDTTLPRMLFFDAAGSPVPGATLVGMQSAARIKASLSQLR